jgi:hypothetical protein
MRAGSAQTLDDSYVAPYKEEGSRWYGAAAVALAAILFLARLGARALWASEGRWAEVVREMVLSANYFWPTINGKLYYDKPLLSYWFIVAASHLTGGVNETATRLPSAIFGLAGVVLIIVVARRLYDRTSATCFSPATPPPISKPPPACSPRWCCSYGIGSVRTDGGWCGYGW